ncbi:MAG TPA: hypothetical protein DCK95_09375 [Anaerolineaceae bacterium]|uniref:Uncharacterized protein n=1 Tax=Anaerolinea thermophila TaxID=167964 RepID=A0A101FXT1_9CHLR|nr:MAG: hypothetical protein XD73_0713 [Anaerolinea thermophila]HAF62523.1 hypothetical protein [Anaerolineaceae bacterium]
MMDVPSLNDLVLVCVIPQPRDLEIARVLGWYRIPLKHAPKVIYTDCLAFYQPASFGKEHRWKIEYIAKVRGVELCRRIDLLREEWDHPRANEEYYKISLDDLVRLPKPISAGTWKRITFFYTGGDLIRNAETIQDLVIDHENRRVFEGIIREYRSKYADIQIANEDEQKISKEFVEYFLQINAASKQGIDQIDLE